MKPISRLFVLFAAVALVLALAMPSVAAKKWREYTDCELRMGEKGNENKYEEANDGDSFHVTIGSLKSADARHKLFRLYFVDTPESETSLPERLEDQRKYWDLPDLQTVVRCGKEAKMFTRRFLQGKFTAYSKLQDALGRSKKDRDYAMIRNAAGEDLGLALARNGYVRVSGMKVDLSDLEEYGKTAQRWQHELEAAEAKAKAERRGCWAYSTNLPGSSPFARPTGPIARPPAAAPMPTPGMAPAAGGVTAPAGVAPVARPAAPTVAPVARPTPVAATGGAAGSNPYAPRTWTSASGSTIEASYSSYDGRFVILRAANGSFLRIAPEKLSMGDQQFLQPLTGRQPTP